MEKELKDKAVKQLSTKKKEVVLKTETVAEGKEKLAFIARPSRQPMLILVCGETGVGKTFRNFQEFRKYLRGIRRKEKKGERFWFSM
jgi:2-phosphoglycerate kinase